MKRMIFANHAHVFPEHIRQDGTIPVLKGIMEEAGIDKCVCFAPFYEYFDGDFDANGWMAGVLKGDTSLVGFGVINFCAGGIGDQVRKIAELGFRGIKLHPAFQKVRIDGAECCQVYEAAQRAGLIISYHTGIHWHRISDYNMLLFDEVAYQYPELRMTLEHVGGYCFFNDALAVMLNNRRERRPCRVFAGLTSVFDRETNKYWFLEDKQIKDLLWLMGEDSAMFGLDFPFNDRGEIKRAIAHIEGMDISESAKVAILGGNLSRELGIE